MDKVIHRDTNNIPILNGSNYTLWHIKMNIELCARRLYTVCTSQVPENATPKALEKWNLAKNKAVSLISNMLHHNVFISIVDSQTVCSANSLWTKIHSKFAPQTFVNKGRVWLRWECLKLNGNIKEYIENCQTLLLDISSIGIVIPNKILAYSILGKISQDCNTYDHIIDNLFMSGEAVARPEIVMDKLLELINHQKTKDMGSSGKETNASKMSALLSNAASYPYKIMYVCQNGNHNPKNTTHKENSCWVLHPELQPTSNRKKSHFEVVEQPLDYLHLDLVGPISPQSVSGYRYFLTIVDQCTSFKIVKFLSNKSDAIQEFKIVKNMIETAQGRRIKKIVSDRGGYFINSEFKQLANESGFIHITSSPYTPQLNGFAERANRAILEKARCLLLGTNLPNQYWAEAVNHATLLINLIPTPSRNNQSPLYHWTGNALRIKRMRTFGYKVVFAIPKEKRPWKLAPTGEVGIMLGMDYEGPAYRVLKLTDKKVFSTRHVIFFKNDFPSPKNIPMAKESDLFFSDVERYPIDEDTFFDCQEHTKDEANSISSEDTAPPNNGANTASPINGASAENSDNNSNNKTTTRPINKIKVIGPQHPTLISSSILEEHILPYTRRPRALLTASNDPLSYKQALKSENADQWVQATNKEVKTMNNLNLWEVVPIREKTRLIGTTWVYKTKRNERKEVSEYKARLCAQGFSQTPGINFGKTFAPTFHLNSLQTLISFAASNNLKFEQVDIKSAFLNAPLEEEVFLAIPHGLDLDKRKVCLQLKKAIYGLRQAPRAWYNQLSEWLETAGFKAAISDPCVFYRKLEPPIWLFIHVDDIAMFGKDLTEFKLEIQNEIKTKLLGQADLLLGIKIHQDKNSISLLQEHYVESLLDLYRMSNCRPVATPHVPNEHLESPTQAEVDELNKLDINYRSSIRSLSYISTATRPDISYAISALSQFLEKPRIRQWKAFLHVLRYLNGTADLCVTYQKNMNESAVAYSDADWGNCRVTRRSVSGHLILLNNELVIWKTKKQPTVSLSSAEAEYKALCNLASEILWFQQFCLEVNITHSLQPMKVYEDNQGCIDTANSDCNANTQRMKHIEIQLHFIQDAIKNSKIFLIYTPTSCMLADFLTNSALARLPDTVVDYIDTYSTFVVKVH
ncbi:hypothetical protein O181_031632 [Austropuccinia psidii MF-1]|uniref:Integrase catalytic domain-containing protein n=1 Tax=Austropuccinia psidii MF-1 TaxID=1389203 RepID=A0A9Q3CY02_9BASI|nr:hypothetical protein [Austropuccinia psidii MF-1]